MERMDCPRVLGKRRNMRGYYCPAQQPDGQQMTFVLPNTLQAEVGRGRTGGGGEEE